MNPIVVVGVLASLLAAGAILVLVRPVAGSRMPWPALAVAAATAILTVAVGRALGVASLEFLIGVSVFTLPVLVLLDAAAIASGAGRIVRWFVIAVWGLVVFPVALLVPLLVTRDCLSPECGFEDFAGALPLVVSSAAFVLLAWLAPAVDERQPSATPPAMPSGRRAAVATGLLWLAVLAWLVHLEGAIDAYMPRIALAALVVPAASAAGWLAVDRVRNVPRSFGRSLVLGLAVGMVVALPGAVSVGMPWFPIAGLLAGAAAALVFSASERVVPRVAVRWAMAVLTAIAVGFVAPAISGDTVGLIFAARAAVLSTPLLVLVAVTAFSITISVPVWLLARRRS